MKSRNTLLKSLFMVLILSQSTAQAWSWNEMSWNEMSKTISSFWQNNKTLIVGVGAALITAGSFLFLASRLKSKKSISPISKKHEDNTQKVLIAETYSLSRILQPLHPQASRANNDAAEQQRHFFDKYFRIDEAYIQTDEMDTIFSGIRTGLNQFIQKNQLRFVQFNERFSGLTLISRVNLDTKLITQAQEAIINHRNTPYKAMTVANNCYVFKPTSLHSTKTEQLPIVAIRTAKGDSIYITKAGDNQFKNSFDLLDYACMLDKNLTQDSAQKAKVTLPIINLSQEVDISWLNGIMINQNKSSVQAKQQVTFILDSKAELKSLAGPSSPHERDRENEQRQEVTINDNFIVWIKGRGAVLPLLAAYIPASSWIKA